MGQLYTCNHFGGLHYSSPFVILTETVRKKMSTSSHATCNANNNPDLWQHQSKQYVRQAEESMRL